MNLTISDKNAILLGSDREADFLLTDNKAQSRSERLNRFSIADRNVPFLLEVAMPKGMRGFQKGNTLSKGKNNVRYWLGKHRSEETKEKIRKANKKLLRNLSKITWQIPGYREKMINIHKQSYKNGRIAWKKGKQFVTLEEKQNTNKIAQKRWRNNNPDYTKNRWKNPEYKEKMLKYVRGWELEKLTSWESIIPKKTNCEICGKEIFFNEKAKKSAIHFDHKTENSIIKCPPTTWLHQHSNTPENLKIWEQCNFGMLCNRCNIILPLKNRKEWIAKVYKYVMND